MLIYAPTHDGSSWCMNTSSGFIVNHKFLSLGEIMSTWKFRQAFFLILVFTVLIIGGVLVIGRVFCPTEHLKLFVFNLHENNCCICVTFWRQQG